MKFLRQFLSIVPKPVQLWAWVLAGCALLLGLVMAYETTYRGAKPQMMATFGAAALVFALFAAAWLLCLGFVFADARRRGMRAVLWVMVAALFPHLLGFLLYFVMRQPIATNCSQCGLTVALHQRFCPWCGASFVPPASDGESFTPNPSAGAGQ